MIVQFRTQARPETIAPAHHPINRNHMTRMSRPGPDWRYTIGA